METDIVSVWYTTVCKTLAQQVLNKCFGGKAYYFTVKNNFASPFLKSELDA